MRTEDGHIIFKCLNGDSAAFGLLVDKYKASIYALAYSKLHNFHDAEDITQEAFIKAYRKLHTLRWWDNFLAWLYAITSNLCKDWIRSQSKRPDREFIADQEPDILERPATDSYDNGDVRESVNEALESLPEIYRQALTLYYLGGMNSREIARFLGTSPNTVAQRLKRGRTRLKEEMIPMMSAAYKQQRLQAGFTFRIVEMVKYIRIRPLPRASWLPIGASAVTALVFAVLSFTSSTISFNPIFTEPAVYAGKQATLPYTGNSEMLTSANIPVTLEMIPGDSVTYSQTSQPAEPLLASASPGVVAKVREQITISGKVVKDGSPVSNARVYIHDRDSGIIKETQTQAGGSFRLEIPEPDDGKWRRLAVVAQHPRYSFNWAKLSKDDAGNVIIELQEPAAITGKAIDTAGNPVQGVEMRMSAIFPVAGPPFENGLFNDAIPVSAVKTDSNGKFTIRNLPAESSITMDIVGPGYGKERTFGILAGAKNLTFTLKREGRIEGRVTLGGTGEPAEGIGIRATGIYPTDGWGESQTDENGYYTLTSLLAGEYDVMLKEKHPDLTATAKEYIKISEGQTVKNVDLKLVKGGFITGRATDKDINEPIQGQWIAFYDASRPESQPSIHSVHTDEDGYFRFRAAPGKAKVYTSAAEGYDTVGKTEKYVNVVDGETVSGVNFQFRMRETLTMTGTVLTFEGEPVAGAIITDKTRGFPRYGESGKDGKFTITGLRPGQKFSVKAVQSRLKLRGFADLEAQPGAEVEILVDKYETASVSGRVMNQQGKPVPLAKLTLIRMNRETGGGIGTSAGMTNHFGEYEISGLIVGDEHQISAEAEGYRGAGTGMFFPTLNMPTLPDIVLPFPGQFFLEGTVKDTNGKPVVGAQVHSRSAQSNAKTDASGHYRLDNLPFIVETTMSVKHPDYGLSTFGYIPTNQTRDFVIVLADRYLAGKVVDADGNPVVNATVHVDPSTDEITGHVNVASWGTNHQGEFRLKHVANEVVSVNVSSRALKYNKVYENVQTNREDVVFVFDKSLEPPAKPPTKEWTARMEYRKTLGRRSEQLSGKPAPELDIAQWLYGKPVTLAQLRDKVVVLYFWTRGARHNGIRAIESVRLLNTLQKKYGEKGLVCVGIHGLKKEADAQRKLIGKEKVICHIALDRESPIAGARGVTFDRYAELNGAVIVDKKGIAHGNVWDHELEKMILEMLSK